MRVNTLLLCTAAILTACSGSPDSGPGTSPTGPGTSTIGPQGGALTFAGGKVTLVFPVGAVSQNVTITVQTTSTFPLAPTAVSGTAYDFSPQGTQFAQPVELTIAYDPTGLPSGVQEGELGLHKVGGNAWQKVEGSRVNVTGNAVSGAITSFSVFGLLGAPVDSIHVSPASGTVTIGVSLQLSATPKDTEGNDLGNRLVTWSSSDQRVATVSATGLVTGVALGTVGIIATSEGRSGQSQLGVAGTSIAITSGPTSPRQGDVVDYTAETRDSQGGVVDDPTLTWSVVPSSAGLFGDNGRFVGYTPGPAEIVAQTSGPADTLAITIGPRGLNGSFSVLGHGEVLSHLSAHIAVHGSFAYTGTINCYRSCGDRLWVWDVSDPANPTLTDSVVAAATRTNDVMVSADGAIAAITHEGGAGGMTLLDLSDPAHPTVITRLITGLELGTHNLWIDGSEIYVASGPPNGLVVVDITNVQMPAVVASYRLGSPQALYGVAAHDVQVRNGIAVISNFEAGLIILDVGGGGAGGSPANAIELSRTPTPTGWTHNAWYWPATGYVFIADEPQVEGLQAPTIYVMDASDPSSPHMVASYTIRGADPHNFWLDEVAGILYVAWRGHGVRAIDVTGTLMGDLEQQGRQVAGIEYDVGDCSGAIANTVTCALSLQVQNGLVYVSDLSSGLWILRLNANRPGMFTPFTLVAPR